MPRPETSSTSARVLSPRAKTASATSGASSGTSGDEEARLHRQAVQARQVEPGPVVLDLDHDPRVLLARGEPHGADRVLARAAPVGGRLDAVRDRVAHEVQERRVQLVDERLVERDVVAARQQAHLLALALGRVAHGRAQPHEELSQRDHARARDLALQAGDHRAEALRVLGDAG